jgi:Family of unknown function (DUF6498)
MNEVAVGTLPEWREVWPDLLAFVAGLGMAWYFVWQSTDLIWSLWLSSLLVGYAMIVWDIFGPALGVVREARANGGSLAAQGAVGAVFFGGGLFLLAFFTFHFGFFHFVHSQFLEAFFPVVPKSSGSQWEIYREVFRRYWYFVPLAALAERQAFSLKSFRPGEAAGISRQPGDDAQHPARNLASGGMDRITQPYKNVIRMHVLIFFFAFAHFAKLENFWIYAVVYAAYFFPWRVLKKSARFQPQG